MKFLDDDAVRAALDEVDVLTAIEAAFVGLAAGDTVQPGQSVAVLPGERGDIIYYPAAVLRARHLGVTVSPYLAQLAEAGEDPVTAYTLVLSAETGRPLLLCDSRRLVAVRTGATTALAVRALVRPRSGRVAIVGTGPIAESHARFILQVGQWESIRFYSPSISGAGTIDAAAAVRREALAAIDPAVGFATSVEDAVRDADVVMLCTSSSTPVLDPDLVAPTALITAVGTDGPSAHEIPPRCLPDLDVYCDYRVTTPEWAADMVLAREQVGWEAASIIADLPELLSAPAVSGTGRTRYFRSIGLGLEDLALAGLLV
ncbi:ornithine cyclodeaminase family protein [Micromonospora sp. NPDC049903]|uniref:ornithine cyclodeaminase family protein n=1 Tax=Micromonospora sp. NPDC049903 TaxID=3364276 RepID=UPI00379A28DA